MSREIDLYISGLSITEVSNETGIALSTIRFRLKKAGVLRSRHDGIKNASNRGKLGVGLRGKKRVFTETHCANISNGRLAWGEKNSAGVSIKPNGYVEYTRGKHKGRSVHVVKMEERLGRRLRNDECVHHIDEDRANNEDSNLCLMTRAGHARHHRMMERLKNERNGL